uniref:Cyclic nucleotide-binding domain-containing protein n=1 Tax=Strigamia maritima TaxID=126957 RepID=T1J311_STRMM
MAGFVDRQFINSLLRHPDDRNNQDLNTIYYYLKRLEALAFVREPGLRALCKAVRYQHYEANDILYCRGELSTCWYILLSGSVFIDGSMFLPRS